jgi:hypothetical protein
VDKSTIIQDLPDLNNQLHSTPSSSDYDILSASSLDTIFETSKFGNLKFESTIPLLTVHSFKTSQFSSVESDCKDNDASAVSSNLMPSHEEVLKILTGISSQMVVGHQELQSQLINNNLQLQTELQRVREENEKFTLEMHTELSNHSLPNVTTPPISSTTSGSSSSTIIQASPTISGSSTSPSTSMDFQSQMLAVLNYTFMKLSTVINDTSTILRDTKTAISKLKVSETKTEWVKFSGDPKKFRSWYLAIMAQLSIALWQDLYDSTTNSVVKTTINAALNGKLYAKVIGALEGSALQHMLARKHLCANGILLLQDLYQMYKPKCILEVIAAKPAEFWGQTKHLSSVSVGDDYNRFQELLAEINEETETIPIKSAIWQFIFTLGTEFEPLQMNFLLGILAPEWKTEDWPTLLVLCHDFYNLVNPRGPYLLQNMNVILFLSYRLIVPVTIKRSEIGS